MSRLPIRAGERFDRISLEAARDSIARRRATADILAQEVNNIFEVERQSSTRVRHDPRGDWTLHADWKRRVRVVPFEGEGRQQVPTRSFTRSSALTRDACTAKTSSRCTAHPLSHRGIPARLDNSRHVVESQRFGRGHHRASGGEYDEIREAWCRLRNARLLPRHGGDVELQFPSRTASVST